MEFDCLRSETHLSGSMAKCRRKPARKFGEYVLGQRLKWNILVVGLIVSTGMVESSSLTKTVPFVYHALMQMQSHTKGKEQLPYGRRSDS